MDRMPVHPLLCQQISLKFAKTHSHVYSWIERGTVKMKLFAQEHNTMTWSQNAISEPFTP